MRLVAEITERALTSRPADLLHMVERVREMGIGIALDDVGADRRSLALMPFLRPDVVKLDLRLVQDRPPKQVAEVHNAVSAHAERTGALVVAEGIETEEHLERARAMGASVGQGWLFGRPGPLPDSTACTAPPVPIFETTSGEAADTPFNMIDGHRPQRRGTKRLLLEISRELERQAELLGDSAVLISTFQHARHFTPPQAELYGGLSRQVAFIGALGQDMSGAPAPGVRGANLTSDDPLGAEWDIVVVSPHFAAAFTARDLGDGGSDMDRRFDFQLTHDRDLAVRAARILMARIEPLTDGSRGARALGRGLARRVGLRPGDDLLRVVDLLAVVGDQHRHHGLTGQPLDLLAAAGAIQQRQRRGRRPASTSGSWPACLQRLQRVAARMAARTPGRGHVLHEPVTDVELHAAEPTAPVDHSAPSARPS